MEKRNLKKTFAIVVSAVLMMALLTGCSGGEKKAETKDVAGTVMLSVNPEIEVKYDENGKVLGIKGVNDDGKGVVSELKEYEGDDCRNIANILVTEIYEAGYFKKTVDGHAKNIVLKLEKGSASPNDDFLENVADGIREAAKSCGIASHTMPVYDDDLDKEGRIGQEKAKELVLAQLGLSSASFNNHECELDDGVYEFEFVANGVEYTYEVDAYTGKILEADFEGNDDWDDMDDWDDWEDYDDVDDYDDDYDDDDDYDYYDVDKDDDDNDDDEDEEEEERKEDMMRLLKGGN